LAVIATQAALTALAVPGAEGLTEGAGDAAALLEAAGLAEAEAAGLALAAAEPAGLLARGADVAGLAELAEGAALLPQPAMITVVKARALPRNARRFMEFICE
jgi:hypothetical protein